MLMTWALAIHLLAAIIWVGGMFFAYVILRPAAEDLLLTDRVRLWGRIFRRFFPWVGAMVVLLPITGYGMIFTRFGSISQVNPYIFTMQTLAWIMIALFLWTISMPLRRLTTMLRSELFPEAGMIILRIRKILVINLMLGLTTAILAVISQSG